MQEKTKKLYKTFRCILGINEGYFHSNEIPNMSKVTFDIQQIADDFYIETGKYITVVVNPARVIYRMEWGCPAGGEDVYELSGNNLFDDGDVDSWEELVNQFILKLKDYFKQITLQVEWNSTEITRYETKK